MTADLRVVAVAAGHELPYEQEYHMGGGNLFCSGFNSGQTFLASIRFLGDVPWVVNCINLDLDVEFPRAEILESVINIPTDFEGLMEESEPIVGSQGASCGLTAEYLADLDRRAELAHRCPLVPDPSPQQEEPEESENNATGLPPGTDLIEQ